MMPGFLNTMRQKITKAKPSRRSTRPAVEGLEERMLLFATNGGMWSYPVRVTYSFVPDGTSIGGVPSNLYATLNATQSQAAWQGAIQQAAALWETNANVNLAQVSDSGAALGVSGNQQGDSRFGDIRISMIPEGLGILASADLPPPYNGGTAAGDITLNSNINWSPTTGYDLESVALHEFGHALGLDHSAQMSAVMYAYYTGTNQYPTVDDIVGIDTVYGPVSIPLELNRTIWTAWNLTPNINSSGQLAIANQSILGVNDCNWWYVAAPANTTGTMTVQMQATNLSSLAPKLAIYNGSGILVGLSNVPYAYGSTATVRITGVTPGQGFYIRNGIASGIGSNGAYGLEVNFGSSAQAPIAPPNTVVLQQPDQGGGSSNDTVGLTTDQPGGWTSPFNSLQASLTSGFGNLGLSQFFSLAGLSLPLGLANSPFLSQMTSVHSTLTTIRLGNLTVFGDYLKVGDLKGMPTVSHTTDTGNVTTPEHGHSTFDVTPPGSPSDPPKGPTRHVIIPLPGTHRHSKPAAPAQSGGAGTVFPDGGISLTSRHRHRPTQ